MLHRLAALHSYNSNISCSSVSRRHYASSKRPSGVTVINTHTSDQSVVSNVSLFVKAGSRYETKLTRGSTHFLKHLAFRNNADEYGLTLVRTIECLGGELLCTVDRDLIGYHIYAPSDKIQRLAPLLKGIASPKLWEYEVDEVRLIVRKELDTITSDVPSVILDSLYQNSFRTSGLAQDVYSTEFDLDRLVAQHIAQHIADNFYPGDRMLVVANGFTSEYEGTEFDDMPNRSGTFELQAYEPLPQLSRPNQDTQFVGGQSFVQGGKNVHVSLGFNGVSVTSNQYAAMLVLKELLGCGTKCGGRLFDLTRNNDTLLQANAFNSSFTDAGLFGIYAESTGNARDLIGRLYEQINALKNVSDQELEVAKKVARGRIVRSKESPLQSNTLTALRYFSAGKTEPVDDAANIQAVTRKDITNIVEKFLSSTPSLVTAGDVINTPSISSLQSQ